MFDVRETRSRRVVASSLVAALTFVYLVGLFVGPRVSRERAWREAIWVTNAWFPGPFGVSMNFDSIILMEATKRPGILLEEKYIYQSRPLLPVLAAGPSRIFVALGAEGWFAQRPDDALRGYVSPFLAWIVLHFVVLGASMALFLRLAARFGLAAGRRTEIVDVRQPALALALLLVFNDVTKAFFFSPHFQLFHVLVPLVTVHLLVEVAEREELSPRWLSGWALALGLATLGYGVFAVAAAVLGAAAWARSLADGSSRSRAFLGLTLVGVVSAAPGLAYWALVRQTAGSLYNNEVAVWRQFVWLGDVRHEGLAWAVRAVGENVAFFLGAALVQMAPAVVVLLLVVLAVRERWSDVRARLDGRVAALLAGLAALFLLFFSLAGYQQPRLATSVSVLASLAVAWVTLRAEEVVGRLPRWAAGWSWVVVVAVGLVTVLKDGPWQ